MKGMHIFSEVRYNEIIFLFLLLTLGLLVKLMYMFWFPSRELKSSKQINYEVNYVIKVSWTLQTVFNNWVTWCHFSFNSAICVQLFVLKWMAIHLKRAWNTWTYLFFGPFWCFFCQCFSSMKWRYQRFTCCILYNSHTMKMGIFECHTFVFVTI